MGNEQRTSSWLASAARDLTLVATVLVLSWMSPAPVAAAGRSCSVAGARQAAPAGMTIGPIDNLNPALTPAPAGVVRVAARDGAYCLITGSIVTRASSGKTANFGLALPEAWNGKFLFSGCSGYCGVVFRNAPDASGGGYPSDALARGYAIAASDGGHEIDPSADPYDASWALAAPGSLDTEAWIDFTHRAVHAVTVATKQVVRRWYAEAIERSYFFGCSEGGREAMMEATRYPTDFDGYIAGAPLFDLPGQILSGRVAQVLVDPEHHIPPASLALVDNVIHATCDDLDGVRDRLIQNPGRCAFGAESLLCKGDNGVSCLTRKQADTLSTWFSAATDPSGRVVSYGFPVSDLYADSARGDNLFRWVAAAGPAREPSSRQPWGPRASDQPAAWVFMEQAMKYLVRLDPDYALRDEPPVNRRGVIDDEALALLVERTDDASSDASALLGPFVQADRKLIMYHGFSDGWVSPYRTLRFYQTWAERAGGYEELQRNARLFMVPGMYHCSHGPGPNVFDALGALERWVEQGVRRRR